FSYELTVNDLTGHFPANATELFLLTGGAVVTSANLDAKSQFAMTMVPGIYQIVLIAANDTYSSTLSLSATDQNPSVLIQTASTIVSVGPFAQFYYTSGWDCDGGGITTSLTDRLGTMTTVTMTLYRFNSSFPDGLSISVYTTTFAATPGTVVTKTHDFRNATIPALNSSTPNDYQIGYVVHIGAVIETLGVYPVIGGVGACPNSFPNPVGTAGSFTIPSAILGLNYVLSGPQ